MVSCWELKAIIGMSVFIVSISSSICSSMIVLLDTRHESTFKSWFFSLFVFCIDSYQTCDPLPCPIQKLHQICFKPLSLTFKHVWKTKGDEIHTRIKALSVFFSPPYFKMSLITYCIRRCLQVWNANMYRDP